MPAGVVGLVDYLHNDNDVVTTEELNNSEIINSLRDTREDGGSDGSETDEQPVPTAAEVLTAINTLHRYACAQDNQERAVEAISVYELSVLLRLQKTVQTKLTDFCSFIICNVSTYSIPFCA